MLTRPCRCPHGQRIVTAIDKSAPLWGVKHCKPLLRVPGIQHFIVVDAKIPNDVASLHDLSKSGRGYLGSADRKLNDD